MSFADSIAAGGCTTPVRQSAPKLDPWSTLGSLLPLFLGGSPATSMILATLIKSAFRKNMPVISDYPSGGEYDTPSDGWYRPREWYRNYLPPDPAVGQSTSPWDSGPSQSALGAAQAHGDSGDTPQSGLEQGDLGYLGGPKRPGGGPSYGYGVPALPSGAEQLMRILRSRGRGRSSPDPLLDPTNMCHGFPCDDAHDGDDEDGGPTVAASGQGGPSTTRSAASKQPTRAPRIGADGPPLEAFEDENGDLQFGPGGELVPNPNHPYWHPDNPTYPYISDPSQLPKPEDPHDLKHTLDEIARRRQAQHDAIMQAINVNTPVLDTSYNPRQMLTTAAIPMLAQLLVGGHSNVGTSILGGMTQSHNASAQLRYDRDKASAEREKALFMEQARLAGMDASDALQAYQMRSAEAAAEARRRAEEQARVSAGRQLELRYASARANAAKDALQVARTPEEVVAAKQVLQDCHDEFPELGVLLPSDATIAAMRTGGQSGALKTASDDWAAGRKRFLNSYGEVDDANQAPATAYRDAVFGAAGLDPASAGALGALPTEGTARAAALRNQTNAVEAAVGWLPSDAKANLARQLAEAEFWSRRSRAAQLSRDPVALAEAMSSASNAREQAGKLIQGRLNGLKATLAKQEQLVRKLRAAKSAELPAASAAVAATLVKIDRLTRLPAVLGGASVGYGSGDEQGE